MNDKEEIYKAAVQNVRELSKALNLIKRLINTSMRRNKEEEIRALTKVYASTYSTWLESCLSKIIHTMDGFCDDEILQIKRESNIEGKWEKTVELTFRKFNRTKRGNEVPNKIQQIHRLIDKYIISPSLIRNKVMHGQWEVALNRENTKVNAQLSQEIQNLSAVEVYKWHFISFRIIKIIEDLIKSNPQKDNWAHYKDYHVLLQEITDFEKKSTNWNETSKTKKLERKNPKTPLAPKESKVN